VRFGISTHLYHYERLAAHHLAGIRSHGFEAIELFATRSHFDYHDERAIGQLERWLRETGLELHSIHAPIVDSLEGGHWGTPFSTATTDQAARERAVREVEAAIAVAGRIAARHLVVHLGMPESASPPSGDNDRGAAIRSVERLHDAAQKANTRIALEVIPNRLSSAGSLVQIIEEELEAPDVGICMDFGHAFLMGDLLDAIETASGLLTTTHVHDNGGKNDDHLAPFDGLIDWPAALISLEKIGYEGMLLFELGDSGAPAEVLQRARRARQRFEHLLGG
jgi:sugar phosphate isomerase/epimerase